MRTESVQLAKSEQLEAAGGHNFEQMLDLSPINTMMATPEGVLTYMNENSKKTLRTLEQFLPAKVDDLVGKSIDWFHKVPSHQLGIIRNVSNLPHRATINVGPEKLDLLVSPILSATGDYLGPMVTWEVVTEKLKIEQEQERSSQMVDLSPINTMMATPDGVLTYMNENSIQTLRTLEQYLPAKVDALVGQKIDWFHKVPEHQLGIIKNPSNLPYKAIIDVGPEKLDLLVSPIVTASGDYLGPMVTWEVVTEKLQNEEEMARVMQMVDKSPINTMMASPEGEMIYMNEVASKTLKTLESLLPAKVDALVGNSIDWFHKNPAGPKRIISDPKNLPHKAIISVGEDKLDLLISPIIDSQGNYMGPMVTWDIVTDKVNLVKELTKSANELKDSAGNLQSVSSSLSSGAEETSAQANTASVASEEVNAGVQTVASNMEEMVAAIKEITKTTNEASSMTNDAMKMAKNTNEIISQLGDSSMDIGNVIKVISSIAQQTNLLALNATIEAARAGEAGKGFAVVANEVKELAKQTAKATADITKKIENIQSDSKGAVNAIKEISEAIEKVNGYAGNIAASVEEQAATTNEVTRIVTESAEGVKQINENIAQVSEAAATTGKDAQSAQEASSILGDIASNLQLHVEKIKV
jgi:methyl-accepting chemotaxis protein